MTVAVSEAFREPSFRLLFAARTISFFGTNLAPIAVAFAVLGVGGSATDVGLAFAAWTLTQVSTLLVGGVPGRPGAAAACDDQLGCCQPLRSLHDGRTAGQ